MDPIIILQAGVASGTVLLFATLGELFAERSGVLNLGVEGMMLMGAMVAFSVTVSTGNGWLGLLLAMFFAGLLALLHGIVTIHFQADQVVSGLSLTFLGTGLSLIFGEGLSKAGVSGSSRVVGAGSVSRSMLKRSRWKQTWKCTWLLMVMLGSADWAPAR